MNMRATGRLTVRVYTSQAQIPLECATVVVTAPGERGKRKLLSVQATDSSGRIRTIELDTPALGESTAPGGLPGNSGPCALCDVWAEHPGYMMLKMENVQIFPGVETVQDMELMPLPQNQCGLQHRTVWDIPAQSL